MKHPRGVASVLMIEVARHYQCKQSASEGYSSKTNNRCLNVDTVCLARLRGEKKCSKVCIYGEISDIWSNPNPNA